MINPEQLHSELQFQTARSGGKGGQNVNKVETKVELRFDVPSSAVLSEEQKATLLEKLANKLTQEGVLVLYHQTERSQLANKDKVVQKFDRLIREAFIVQKKRKATRPTQASVVERLQKKQRKSAVKSMRRKPPIE
ncbi:alternative ribosome rescue aminoacyl-tRNA hydrolase ArfB [Telluribacter sp. SYSU D00476]|uniref:alternative ribosome rescue aminoacyl-tRNA hydrolase ArfB n=1 Tax=Telluribacter sp. SYSU D00476 TaxID=2811430 RepID=UPI001FF19CD1|nr:alternative ribosome rescue aminoacyl-tRNA hydrolase ArfB [Telluribacter sp. SYSU D00476]